MQKSEWFYIGFVILCTLIFAGNLTYYSVRNYNENNRDRNYSNCVKTAMALGYNDAENLTFKCREIINSGNIR